MLEYRVMGFYRNGRYVYEPMDAGNGVCEQSTYDKQKQKEQKKLDENNAGEIKTPITKTK